jgi:hypothetical protein
VGGPNSDEGTDTVVLQVNMYFVADSLTIMGGLGGQIHAVHCEGETFLRSKNVF